MIDIERYQAFRAAWDTLTPQQRRVTTRRCRGLTNVEVGARMCVSPQTVKNHITLVLEKLHPVVSDDAHGRRGTMDAVCWRIGYESAVRDIAQHVAARKAG